MTDPPGTNSRSGPPQPARSGSFPRRWALLLVLGVPVVVVLALALSYYRLVHFERIAALHLPEGTRFAARVDMEQVVLFEPVRKNLLPALDGATTKVDGQSLTQRIATATGVNLAMDLREIVFAVGPEPERWLLVLSGLFPSSSLQAVVAAVSADSRIETSERGGGVQQLEPWGMFMAQARDGVFLVSNHEPLLRAALEPTGVFDELGLAREGAGGVAARFSAASPSGFGALRSLRATVELGATLTVRVEAEPAAGVGGDAARWLAEAKLRAASADAAGAPWGALRPGLARAEPSVGSENHWVFETFYERHEADILAADLAARLAHRLQLSAAPPK